MRHLGTAVLLSRVATVLALAAALPDSASSQDHPDLNALKARALADSNDATVQYDLAMAYWKEKRWDQAEHLLRQATAIAQQYADAWLALAVLPEARGEDYWKEMEKSRGKAALDSAFQEGSRYYSRAFLINPLVDLKVIPRVEERVSLRINGVTFFVWWAFPFTKALNNLREGKLEEGLDRLQKIIDDERAGSGGQYAPDAARWYHGIAAAHLQRYDLAVNDFWALVQGSLKKERDAVPDPFPLHTNEYRYMLGTMLYLGGRINDAVPVFRHALEFDAGLYPAHVQLARMYESGKLWEQAVVERRRAVEADPDDPGLLVDLAGTLIQAGQLADAEEPLRQAIESGPHDARAPYLLGLVALQLGKRDEAREALTRFLAIAPSRFAAQIAEVKVRLDRLQ